jgi:hypothetical protein
MLRVLMDKQVWEQAMRSHCLSHTTVAMATWLASERQEKWIGKRHGRKTEE